MGFRCGVAGAVARTAGCTRRMRLAHNTPDNTEPAIARRLSMVCAMGGAKHVRGQHGPQLRATPTAAARGVCNKSAWH